MCGIAGFYNPSSDHRTEPRVLHAMTRMLSHRGPDDEGFHYDGNIGLGQSRLSIIDLSGGRQPIYNEDRSVCVVFNGEIYNYIELTDELKAKGHRFATKSDTEAIVHAYEEYGTGCLDRFNGQFAIAIWDSREQRLFLARDRIGIRPLFYAFLQDGTLLFGSEAKALFRHPGIRPRIDHVGLDQLLSLWVTVPPRTIFEDVNELAPGSLLTFSRSGIHTERYWRLSFPQENEYERKPLEWYTERLHELLYDAVTLRLRADVPVAAYLSGGIDSSIISAMVKKYHNNDLMTFSVAFADKEFDERPYQERMVAHLGTDHRCVEATYDSIGEAFTDVAWYAEKPTIRTAPAPLYILSRLVRDNNIKVVLTGEGADEIFGGYNIFKEDKVRRFWARFPDSKIRPLLLGSLYPYISRSGRNNAFWLNFFKRGLTDTDNPYYSHLIRWNNTAQTKRLFRPEVRERFDEAHNVYGPLEEYIDPAIGGWHPLCRAQYLEISLFLSGYLLSTQGDRMMMGNSVEGRFPFLDHRVVEFAATIPPEYKLNGLNEKYILKKAFADYIPDEITNRPKQPYRAPIYRCFSDESAANRGARLLHGDALEEYGYLDPRAVKVLLARANKSGGALGAKDDMAIAAGVSLQLLHDQFIEGNRTERRTS